MYLLPGDVGLGESLRAVRAAKARSDAGASKRAALEREIDRASEAALAAMREARELNARLANTKKNDTRRYNEIVGQIRDADIRRAEADMLADSKDKELSRLGDGHDDYVSLAMSLWERMESDRKRYDALATDLVVVAAIEALNATAAGTPKAKLGPSAAFARELPSARQARDVLASKAIKLTINGGVPCALVMLNDRTSVMMTVDSGASILTLSADVAQELGMRPGKNAPVTQLTVADGKTVEGRLATLDKVRVGPFTVTDVPCVILSASVRGSNLLGGTFLKNFICRMDLATQELHLTPVGPEVTVATVAPRVGPEVAAAPSTMPTTGPTVSKNPLPAAPAAAGGGTVAATYTRGKSSIQKLVTGAQCFGNRKYQFVDVPAALGKLVFTRRNGGGDGDEVTLEVPAATAVYVLFDSDHGDNHGSPEFHRHLAETGWMRLEDLAVGGLQKNTPLAVYRKVPVAAERIDLKVGGFSGLMIAAQSLTVSP
jgi:aspartyl protease family protein